MMMMLSSHDENILYSAVIRQPVWERVVGSNVAWRKKGGEYTEKEKIDFYKTKNSFLLQNITKIFTKQVLKCPSVVT